MQRAAAVLALPVFLAACGPVSLEQAERECFERARLAAHPRGSVTFGAGTGVDRPARGRHSAASLDLTVSSDYLMGRDPSALYDACVQQRSGQLPSQPLYTRPDWKG